MVDSLSSLAKLIQNRQISPTEVVKATLDRIDEHNPSLNAFVYVDHQGALEAARESEQRLAEGQAGPLEGVPIAIKDDLPVAGMPLSEGTAMLPSSTPSEDAHLVKCLRNTGAIVVGKTNLPEFGTLPVTEGKRWGPCRNPWNLEHTPGGSSGGSAAAVAASLVSAASGSDGGGSLRIPASCCGVFTLKPTKGLISISPFDSGSELVAFGYLTRNVLDNALLFDLTAGTVPGDATWLPQIQHSFVDAVHQALSSPPRLKIGWTTTPPIDTPVNSACVQAASEAAQLCADLGHIVEPVIPDWQSPLLEEQFMNVWSVLIGSSVEQALAQGGDLEKAEPHNRALFDRGRALSATTYYNTLVALRGTVRRIIPTWNDYDIILTPALAHLPPRIGETFEKASANPWSVLDQGFGFNPFMPIVNITGQPAAQIPISWHGGLPVGVQAIGRHGEEATLFQLSAQIEDARSWATRLNPSLALRD